MLNEEQKEMLKLAAKACGIEVWWYAFDDTFCLMGYHARWNPLTDDGDCARMEAQLLIDVEWGDVAVWPKNHADTIRVHEFFDKHDNDRNAARRLASCRVAAEIGRGMS